MKEYESFETDRRLMPGLPVMVRLDGRSFSKFTKGMTRPFHEPMSRAMIETARYLVKEAQANFAYTQSDEISLVFWNPDYQHDPMFKGRVQKLTSILASMATSKFGQLVAETMPDRSKLLPAFDARVFNMPNLAEMTNCVLFRVLDCAKNPLTMAASAYYRHSELHGKSGSDKHEMLRAKGVNWAHYPEFFKNGTFLRRESVVEVLPAEILAKVPEQHRDRTSTVKRSKVVEVVMPPFSRLANQEGFLFRGEAPVLRTAEPPFVALP